MRFGCIALVLAAALGAMARASEVRRVPLEIFASQADVGAYPIEIGLPFPAGVLSDPAKIRLLGPDGAEIPLQVEPLSRYADGSLRAALLVFFAPIFKDRATTNTAEFGEGVARKAAGAAMTVSEKDGVATVNTGALKFQVGKGKPLFSAVSVGGKEILPGGVESFIQEAGQKDLLFGEQAEVTVEERGPVRAVVLVKGRFGSAADAHGYEARIHAYAGTGLVRLQHTVLGLDGKKALDLAGWGLRIAECAKKAGCGVDGTAGDLSPAKREGLFQDGVFEWTWGPLSVEEKENRLKKRIPLKLAEGFGWRYRMVYSLGAGGRIDGKADGWLACDFQRGGVLACVRDFWQQYPKEFACDADWVTIWLHSPRGKRFTARAGTAKTHEVLLDFSVSGGVEPRASALNAVLQDWPHARVGPEWVCGTGVLGPLLPRRDAFAEGWNAMVDVFVEFIKQTSSLISNRTCWYLYGNADFGDYYNSTCLGVPHETSREFMLEFLRGGDRECARIGARAARHYGDIDVCHAETGEGNAGRPWIPPDWTKVGIKPAFWAGSTHGFVWDAALAKGDKLAEFETKINAEARKFEASAWPLGPHQFAAYGAPRSPDWSYHTGGAMPYCLLTGDRRSLEALREQADWIMKARGTVPALKTAHSFSLSALMDAYDATGDAKYLKAAGDVMRDLIAFWKIPSENRRDVAQKKQWMSSKKEPEAWNPPSHGFWELGIGKHDEGGIILRTRRSRSAFRFLDLNVPESETGVSNEEVRRMLSECAETSFVAKDQAAGCTPGHIYEWAAGQSLGLWSEAMRKAFEEKVLVMISHDRKPPYDRWKKGLAPAPVLKYKLPFLRWKWNSVKNTGEFVKYDAKDMGQTYIFNRFNYEFTCDMAEYGICYTMPGYPHFVAVWKQYHEKYLKPRLGADGALEFKIEPEEKTPQ